MVITNNDDEKEKKKEKKGSVKAEKAVGDRQKERGRETDGHTHTHIGVLGNEMSSDKKHTHWAGSELEAAAAAANGARASE